jgi:hypothetical protein
MGALLPWLEAELTTHLHLMLRLRKVELTSTPPYVFTAWWLIN